MVTVKWRRYGSEKRGIVDIVAKAELGIGREVGWRGREAREVAL